MLKRMLSFVFISFFLVLSASCSQEDGKPNRKAKSKLLSIVPADTIYFAGGQGSEALAQLMQSASISSLEIDAMSGLLNSLAAEDASNQAKYRFVQYILQQFLEIEGDSATTGLEFAGVDPEGLFALYSHGLAPVLRASLKNADVFEKLIQDAVKESGWAYATQMSNNTEIKYWPLGEDTFPALAISIVDSDFVITLLNEQDDESTIQERFGHVLPNPSLADSGEMSEIDEKHGYATQLSGFVHLERIAAGVLDSTQNRFGADIAKLSQHLDGDPLATISPACRRDIMSIVSVAPRIVSGYKRLDSQQQSVIFDADMVLEINDPSLTSEFVALRGHLPEHALSTDDKLAAFAFGINAETLVPVLTNLWSRFTTAEYTCDHLVALQEKAKKANPALLGLGMGMVQGIKGLGVSIFDLTWDAQTGLPKTVSAIVSIAAESPATISSSLALIPAFPKLSIPPDGSPIDVRNDFVPGTKAAIKGKHLVLYAGDDHEQRLKAMASEALAPNGIFSIGMNYRKARGKFADIVAGLSKHGIKCTEAYLTMSSLRGMSLDATMQLDTNALGITMASSGTIDYVEPIAEIDAGVYQVSELDDTCQWRTLATANLKKDRSGTYTQKSSDGKCTQQYWEYDLGQRGTKLVWNMLKTEQRDNCEAEAISQENISKVCHIIHLEKRGFECVFDGDSEQPMIRRFES